jgi:hypothetical protein
MATATDDPESGVQLTAIYGVKPGTNRPITRIESGICNVGFVGGVMRAPR